MITAANTYLPTLANDLLNFNAVRNLIKLI